MILPILDLLNLGLCFKTENLFGAQFELEKCILILYLRARNISTKI